jgi:hypothetical protein
MDQKESAQQPISCPEKIKFTYEKAKTSAESVGKPEHTGRETSYLGTILPSLMVNTTTSYNIEAYS